MNPEDDGCSTGIVEDIVEYLKDSLSQEELQLLLTHDDTWKRFLAEAELSRDEAYVLQEALNKFTIDTVEESKNLLPKEKQDRNSLSDEFLCVITELEEHIRELHALADEVDKMHRKCTISNVVANSTGVTSGILTILGFALAPVTAGASLALSTTGMGLGTVAAIASISSSIMESKTTLSAKAKARKLVSTDDHEGGVAKTDIPSLVSLTYRCMKLPSKIGKNVRAIKLAKANPHLVANARKLMTTGTISVKRAKEVQKAFGGTTLAMTKGARVMGMATTGVFLLMDVVNLVQESKHLHNGAKSESAEELREEAWELERKLEGLIQIRKNLQQNLTP